MARPSDSYPDSATLGGQDERANGETPDALRAALADHDGELAAAVETTDELADLLVTAVVVAAALDEEELDHLTDSTSNLVAAADGLTTDEAATLADDLGENAAELSAALDAVLELQRAGALEDLVALAGTLSTLDIDGDTADGLNAVLGAVGAAQREQEPVSVLGLLAGVTSRDSRRGLGYLLSFLQALGRRVATGRR